MPSVNIEDTTSESELTAVRIPLQTSDRVFITIGDVTYRGTLANLLAFVVANFNLSAYVTTASIVNVLTSTSATVPASANTVKALKDLIDAINISLSDKCPLVDGLVPSANLPSFVDDALEFANLAAFPVTGVSGKIYIALNTNLIYRWTGSTYVLIGDGTSVDVVAAGSAAFPRYDQAQSLSDAQKAQLLTNIGAKKSYNMLPTKTAPYAPTLADFKDAVDLYDKVYLRMNLSAIGDVTISSALTSLPNLTEITIRDLGAARATLVESGTTLNGIKTFTVQNEAKTLVKVGANEWDIIGALT
jgi:hypothetical protein